MSETAERYRTIADAFGVRVQGIASASWSATTPCSDWTVRDLVAHVVETNRNVLATLDETKPVEVDSDDDLPRQWRAASSAISEALDDEARASKVVSGMLGEQSFEAMVGSLLCADTLIHTWDLARATGQDERIDADATSKALEFLTPLDEGIRSPGGFDAKITPAPAADEQTTLLNFCGRAV